MQRLARGGDPKSVPNSPGYQREYLMIEATKKGGNTKARRIYRKYQTSYIEKGFAGLPKSGWVDWWRRWRVNHAREIATEENLVEIQSENQKKFKKWPDM